MQNLVGKKFTSNNSGEYVVIRDVSWREVHIRFLLTKYETVVQRSKIKTGSIKDPYFPRVYGIGFFGVGEYLGHVNNRATIEYNRWYGIFERCYDERHHANHPSYYGCEVHRDWHNFQNFAKWFNDNKPSGDISKFDIDKDIKVKGNRIYGPSTCLIVPSHVNLSFSNENKSPVEIRSPDGDVYSVCNVTRFAKENDLIPTLLWKVIKKERTRHKGWTLVSQVDYKTKRKSK